MGKSGIDSFLNFVFSAIKFVFKFMFVVSVIGMTALIVSYVSVELIGRFVHGLGWSFSLQLLLDDAPLSFFRHIQELLLNQMPFSDLLTQTVCVLDEEGLKAAWNTFAYAIVGEETTFTSVFLPDMAHVALFSLIFYLWRRFCNLFEGFGKTTYAFSVYYVSFFVCIAGFCVSAAVMTAIKAFVPTGQLTLAYSTLLSASFWIHALAIKNDKNSIWPIFLVLVAEYVLCTFTYFFMWLYATRVLQQIFRLGILLESTPSENIAISAMFGIMKYNLVYFLVCLALFFEFKLFDFLSVVPEKISTFIAMRKELKSKLKIQ